MNEPIPVALEVELLCHALVEGRITAQEQDRLEHLVRTDAEAKRLYIEYINLHAALYRYNSASVAQAVAPAENEARSAQPSAKTTSPVLGFLGDCLDQAASFLFKSNVFTLLVAVGLPGLILLVLVIGLISQPPPESPAATVGVTRDCQGVVADRNGICPLYTGLGVYQGQEISLTGGLAELTFANGATMLLEAPATFTVRNQTVGFLRVGRLAASVPSTGHGFTVETPLARVVDLGTDFGVWVAENGSAETHVFKGQVEVAAKGLPNQSSPAATRLCQGQAARVSAVVPGQAPRLVAMTAAPDQFVRSLPAPVAPSPRVRFAHGGEVDPVAEGWRLQVLEGMNLREAQTDPSMMAPASDDGTPAWMLSNHSPDREIRYSFSPGHGLNQATIARAEANGWVMRARIKVNGLGPNTASNCHCIYYGGDRVWGIFPGARPDGTQAVVLLGESSLGKDATYAVPNSHDRYVDYEIRYNPATNDAEVLVDGQRIATGFFREKDDRDRAMMGLQFGLQKRLSEARFARIEWETLGN